VSHFTQPGVCQCPLLADIRTPCWEHPGQILFRFADRSDNFFRVSIPAFRHRADPDLTNASLQRVAVSNPKEKLEVLLVRDSAVDGTPHFAHETSADRDAVPTLEYRVNSTLAGLDANEVVSGA
jgi:hypothetical protein